MSEAKVSFYPIGVPPSRTITINGVTQDLSADRSWTITSIQYWAENYSATTQATSQWTPLSVAANVNAAITPKGTGAIVAAIPDGTAVGGNARGAYAVDLQMVRNNANQVVSSTASNSSILGGNNNRIGSTQTSAISTIAGGGTNLINCSYSGFIGGGDSNTINSDGWQCAILGGGSNSITARLAAAIIGGNSNSIGSGGDFSIVGGRVNTSTGESGFIGGGRSNTVSGTYATISGGQTNTASAAHATVGGGQSNQATATHATIAGGVSNIASRYQSFIGGGYNNRAQGYNDVIVGGGDNASFINTGGNEDYRFIGGGRYNAINANSEQCVIVGGYGSTIFPLSSFSTIGGGRGNSLSGGHSTISGGRENRIGNTAFNTALYGYIGGGYLNVINTNSDYSTLVGGQSNTISGVDWAFIGGGQLNTISADYANIKGGYQAVASLYGQSANASGSFSTAGDAQAHELIWRSAITGTAQTELFLNGASIAAILPGTNAIWNGIIDVMAVCTATGNGTTVAGDVEATSYKVTIKRIGTTTSLVGTVQEIGTTNSDASMSTGAFTIDNNDTNESLRIRFTPPTTAGSTTVIRTIATFRGQQIQY